MLVYAGTQVHISVHTVYICMHIRISKLPGLTLHACACTSKHVFAHACKGASMHRVTDLHVHVIAYACACAQTHVHALSSVSTEGVELGAALQTG